VARCVSSLSSAVSSQNQRGVEVGRELWRSSGPTSLLNQGCLEPVAQDHVQVAFEYLQGWTLCNLPGEPVPGLSHFHSEKTFPDVHMAAPVFSVCAGHH